MGFAIYRATRAHGAQIDEIGLILLSSFTFQNLFKINNLTPDNWPGTASGYNYAPFRGLIIADFSVGMPAK